MMYARLTEEGTAAGETAICSRCFPRCPSEVLDLLDADDVVTDFRDCSGNEALSCNVCGVPASHLDGGH